MNYFELFPLLDYDGTRCVDLTRRVVVRSSITGDPKAYSPYEVPAGERVDQLAKGYYGSQERDWLVYFSVDAIDPYFDWYLSEDDFASFVLEKYGSLEEAVQRVHHWEVDWYGGSTELSPQSYESLSDDLKPFYEPLFGVGSAITSYIRREDDVRCTTNMVVTLEVGAHDFEEGERLRFYDGAALEGSAELAWANSTHLRVIHVQTGANAGFTVEGVSSGESLEILDRTYTANVIPIDARPFWAPISCIDFERDRNESKKNVRILDARHADLVEIETSRLLRSDV